MAKKRKFPGKERNIEPGMVVEATRGDLGEQDVSKPRVTDVVEDQAGNVEKLLVEKGVIFNKKLEVPADRVRDVEQEPEDEKTPGKVTIDVGKEDQKLGIITNIGLIVTALLLITATALLVFGIATGQGG
jgi:hypothetical protein